MKRKTITVKLNGQPFHRIARVISCEPLGNFNLFTCRYQCRTFMLKSEKGDLSDPFRVDKSYFDSLYLDLENPCQ